MKTTFYLLSCPGAEAPLFCGASEQGQVRGLPGGGGFVSTPNEEALQPGTFQDEPRWWLPESGLLCRQLWGAIDGLGQSFPNPAVYGSCVWQSQCLETEP